MYTFLYNYIHIFVKFVNSFEIVQIDLNFIKQIYSVFTLGSVDEYSRISVIEKLRTVTSKFLSKRTQRIVANSQCCSYRTMMLHIL